MRNGLDFVLAQYLRKTWGFPLLSIVAWSRHFRLTQTDSVTDKPTFTQSLRASLIGKAPLRVSGHDHSMNIHPGKRWDCVLVYRRLNYQLYLTEKICDIYHVFGGIYAIHNCQTDLTELCFYVENTRGKELKTCMRKWGRHFPGSHFISYRTLMLSLRKTLFSFLEFHRFLN